MSVPGSNRSVTPEITPFRFDDRDVRVLIDLEGNPWWVASDVCAVLSIADVSDAVNRLDQPDRGKTPARNARGEMRPTWIINESGLYELIFRSNKPDARAFRRWVTSEVLPQIRRTGGYSSGSAELSPLDQLEMYLRHARAQEAATAALTERTLRLEARVADLQGSYDEFAALGYAKLNDLPTDRPLLSRLGKAATRIMRGNGQEPRTRQDATFGSVNVYPVWALDQAAEELGLSE